MCIVPSLLCCTQTGCKTCLSCTIDQEESWSWKWLDGGNYCTVVYVFLVKAEQGLTLHCKSPQDSSWVLLLFFFWRMTSSCRCNSPQCYCWPARNSLFGRIFFTAIVTVNRLSFSPNIRETWQTWETLNCKRWHCSSSYSRGPFVSLKSHVHAQCSLFFIQSNGSLCRMKHVPCWSN